MFIFVVQVAVDIFTIGEYRPAAVKLPLLLHGTGNLPVVPDALLLIAGAAAAGTGRGGGAAAAVAVCGGRGAAAAAAGGADLRTWYTVPVTYRWYQTHYCYLLPVLDTLLLLITGAGSTAASATAILVCKHTPGTTFRYSSSTGTGTYCYYLLLRAANRGCC